ncbi:MAG: DUF362 domain-containing protein [Kofleriaceae bacterium]|nr:DUF362 domain-containing protein [Kofleriaceae bacterium]MCB9572072.1 DUF362 domain-containing protein [Kofleriaceae bacterium]
MQIPAAPKVIIRSCREYDPEKIRRILREGLEELGLRPFGRTLVKPNLVAAGDMFPHAFTRPEFGEGMLRALKDVGSGSMSELAAGERCGITVPTRLAFRESGWDDVIAKVGGVKRYCFEESEQVEIPLRHEGRLRDYLFTPEPVARADFFVNAPKFKAHPWTTVTFSIKAYIGIQDDRHRLIDHDHKLNEKIGDLQFIVQPQFIAIDAITAGEGRMLTPTPFDLGLIIMGNSQVAFDSVCCRIIGLDPRTVEHIRIAEDYGFGTSDADKIEITGDVTLAEAQQRAKGFRVGLIRVEKYFEGTHITAYAGPPPEPEHSDYCWGGCPGAIEEAIEILRVYDAQTDAKLPHMHVVFGNYDGPIPAKPGEKVIFIGDCAQWKGELAGKPVQIRSIYRDREHLDPHTIRHEDIFKKMAVTTKQIVDNRAEPAVRLEGCPVSVAEQVLALVSLGGLKNPYTDRRNIGQFLRGYLGWRGRVALNRLQRKRYQQNGAFGRRGEAAPQLKAAKTAT